MECHCRLNACLSSAPSEEGKEGKRQRNWDKGGVGGYRAHLLWVIRVRLKRRAQLNGRTEWGEGSLVDCKGESQGVRRCVWDCGMSRGGKVPVNGYFVKEHHGTP